MDAPPATTKQSFEQLYPTPGGSADAAGASFERGAKLGQAESIIRLLPGMTTDARTRKMMAPSRAGASQAVAGKTFRT
jgi:hypothetical protein